MKKIKEEIKGLLKTTYRFVRVRSVSRQLEKLFYTQEGLDNNISFIERFKKKYSIKKKPKEKKNQEATV